MPEATRSEPPRSSITTSGKGPDVYYDTNANYRVNGEANLTVPLTGSPYGARHRHHCRRHQRTYTVGLSKIQSTAAAVTPADSTKASANPGQVVSLSGSGLSTSTGVVAQYVDNNGNPAFELLHPFYADVAGDLAQVTVPNYYNGAFAWHIVGSTAAPLVQIVPLITAASTTSVGSAQILGYGFEEAHGSSYSFAGSSLVDSSATSGPDVYYGNNVANGIALSAPPTSGAGCSRSPRPGAPAHRSHGKRSARIWAISPTSPATRPRAHCTSPLTTATRSSESIPPPVPPSAPQSLCPAATHTALTGLQVLPKAMTLKAISVAAGSLLVTDGYANPDRVDAINPATGSRHRHADLAR